MRIIVVAVFVCCVSVLFSQNYGFLGKKNIIELESLVNFPLLSNSSAYPFYKVDKAGMLEKKRDWLDFAFQVNFVRSIGKRFSIGFQYACQRVDVAGMSFNKHITLKGPSEYDYYSLNFRNTRSERFLLNYQYFVPKIELKNKNALFGLGINHQIGFGMGIAKLVSKDYVYEYDKSFEGWVEDDSTKAAMIKPYENMKLTPLENQVKIWVFEYSINCRKPITEFLSVNYGIRYSLSLPEKIQSSEYIEGKEYFISAGEAKEWFSNAIGLGFIQFKFGIGYVF
ncbi:MAG: hypothetical protein ACO1O6_15830 [Bacteroidota bacterium]